MNEETFLSALREHPTDEVTWLALADWFDDYGQSQRAELLRLTRRLRTMPVRGRGRKEVAGRVTELLDAGVRPVVVEIVNSIGMRFALVPPGVFQMGSPRGEKGRLAHEQQHEVEITKPFWLGVFPVTQGQWRTVMGDNPSTFRSHRASDDFPVEQVSWQDVAEFMATLTDLPAEKKSGRTTRLPTEAEWERACRGFGTQRAYHFGDRNSHRHANFIGGGLNRTTKVGSYPPNSLGLYDMHGNVWEWCRDAYQASYYRDSPREDPWNVAYDETPERAIRGGAYFWQCRASEHIAAVTCESAEGGGAYHGQCRSASREGWREEFVYSDLGFRAAVVMKS